MGYANSPCPTPRGLEDIYYPNPTTIGQKIQEMLGLEADIIISTSPEIDSFRGPFSELLRTSKRVWTRI